MSRNTAMTSSEPNSAAITATTKNYLVCLPVELLLAIMERLDSIYTLKFLLEAFPDDLVPLFKTYSKPLLNTIFWRPVRHYSDENGVVYRWILRELNLAHLLDTSMEVESRGIDSHGAVRLGKEDATRAAQTGYRKDTTGGFTHKARDRFILSDGNDID